MILIKNFSDAVDFYTQNALRLFREGKGLESISNEEIEGLASKKKRRVLLQSREMPKIERGAEKAYRDYLRKNRPDLYDLYVRLKEGRLDRESEAEGWKKISEEADDTAFKKDCIQSKITPSKLTEGHFYEDAIIEAINRKVRERFKIYGDRVNKEISNGKRFSSLAETLRVNASDILYEETLEESILEHLRAYTPLTFLFYICLRQTHSHGIPDITPHLNQTTKVTLESVTEKRTGERYRFQIDELKSLSELFREVSPSISLKVLVADFDIYRYGEEHHARLREQAEEYTKKVRSFASPIETEGECVFFERLGYDRGLYQRIYSSILLNDGKYFKREEVEMYRHSYFEGNRRILKDWDQTKNNHFTASAISRFVTEGLALSKGPKTNYVIGIFNENVALGGIYNRLACKRLPFFSIFNQEMDADYSRR